MGPDQGDENRAGQASQKIGDEEFSGVNLAQSGDEAHQIVWEDWQDKGKEKEQGALLLSEMVPLIDHMSWSHAVDKWSPSFASQQEGQLAGDHRADLSDQCAHL